MTVGHDEFFTEEEMEIEKNKNKEKKKKTRKGSEYENKNEDEADVWPCTSGIRSNSKHVNSTVEKAKVRREKINHLREIIIQSLGLKRKEKFSSIAQIGMKVIQRKVVRKKLSD